MADLKRLDVDALRARVQLSIHTLGARMTARALGLSREAAQGFAGNFRVQPGTIAMVRLNSGELDRLLKAAQESAASEVA